MADADDADADDESEDDDPISKIFERARRRKGAADVQFLAGLLSFAKLKGDERAEAADLEEARALSKELEVAKDALHGVLSRIAKIDERRRVRSEELRSRDPKVGLLASMLPVIRSVFSKEPLEVTAQRRAQIEAAFSPGLAVIAETQADLLDSFENRSVRHPTARPGLPSLIEIYEQLGLSEGDMAKIEGLSRGAIHQARLRLGKSAPSGVMSDGDLAIGTMEEE